MEKLFRNETNCEYSIRAKNNVLNGKHTKTQKVCRVLSLCYFYKDITTLFVEEKEDTEHRITTQNLIFFKLVLTSLFKLSLQLHILLKLEY